MKEFSLDLRVYIEDTDAGGIVYYVNYLKYMERARTEMLRSLGFNKAGANPGSIQFVVRSVRVEYLRPARLDDQLAVTARVTSLGGASLDFQQQVLRGAELLCEADVRIACADGASLKPARIGAEMKRALTES
jgi:4-hydroxybenzoyl-CoA thioesterase/acyl-CoA thioester hydrolase